MAQLFANNASTTLTVALPIGAGAMTVADGSRFPLPTNDDFFLATLIGFNSNGQEASWEIVRVTVRSSNFMTITRAQEGTSQALWPVGTRVELRVTAGTLPIKWVLYDGALSAPSFPMTINTNYLVTAAAPQVFTLPAGTQGATIRVKVTSRASPVNYVRLIPNGSQVIAGQAGGVPLDIDSPFTDLTLVYDSSLGWVL